MCGKECGAVEHRFHHERTTIQYMNNEAKPQLFVGYKQQYKNEDSVLALFEMISETISIDLGNFLR